MYSRIKTTNYQVSMKLCHHTIIIMLLLMMSLKLVSSKDDDLCTRRIPLIVRKCDKENMQYCCGTSSRQLPCDKNELHDLTCRSGFYKRGNVTLPCPPGFFCPRDRRCMIPCDEGMLCMGSHLVRNSTSLCRDTAMESIGQSVTMYPLLLGGKPVCPGEGDRRSCDKGFYCPTPLEIYPCPFGKLCPKSSKEPHRCNFFESCSPFIDVQLEDVIGLILLGILAIFIVVVMLIRCKLKGKSILIGYREKKVVFPNNKNPFKMSYNLQNGLWKACAVDISGQRINLPRTKHALSIKLKDLTFTLTDGKKVLENINAEFHHGRLNIVMGPTGCGKSTLLDAMIGHHNENGDFTGKLYLNGKATNTLSKFRNHVGYVMQQDLMHSNLTIKEILTYQAQLRLSKYEGNKYITSSVQEIITLLSLNRISDRVVGNPEDKLISGGQRKRISIAMELVANPSILLLDEPTSGLDSATSLMIMQLLSKLSHQCDINIICVIHQPRVELFDLFDTTTLLTPNGRLVYNAEAAVMVDHFKQLDYHFPHKANPADIMMDIVCGFAVSSQCDVKKLPHIWKKGREYREQITEYNPKHNTLLACKAESLGFLGQLAVILHRECISMIRSFPETIKEICLILLLSLLFAYIFRKEKFSQQLMKFGLEINAIALVSGVTTLRFFGGDLSLFLREPNVNTLSYFVAKNLIHLPMIFFFMPISFLGIYWTAGSFLTSYQTVYVIYVLAFFSNTGISYLIATIFNQRIRFMVLIALTILFAMVSGVLVTICDMDKMTVIGPLLYHTSYGKYFVQARLITETEHYMGVYNSFKFQFMWRNNYATHSDVTSAYWAMLCIGITTRLLTLLVLFYRKSSFRLTRFLTKQICKPRVLSWCKSSEAATPYPNMGQVNEGHDVTDINDNQVRVA